MIKKITRNVSVHRRDIFALCILFLPILIWLYKLLLPQYFWFWGDIAFYFFPITFTGMAQWFSGTIPLWSHLVQCGFPMLADGQGALLYPLNFIFYRLFQPVAAHNFLIVFHVLITATGMYFFCRTLSISRLGAILAGWLWVFSGPISISIGSPALNTLTWWPFLFILAEYCARTIKWRYCATIALITGCMWLGGFPQITYYGIAAASLYFLCRMFSCTIKSPKILLHKSGVWFIALAIGISIAAVQLLPTSEMASLSIRANGTDYTFATQFSMFPTGFLSFILPNWTMLQNFQISGFNLFFGFLCVMFFVSTILLRTKKNLVYTLWGLLLFGCFFSIGKYNPAYHLLYMFPGFNNFRNPSRLLYITLFCMPILTAIGFDALFELIKTNNRTSMQRYIQRSKKILAAVMIIAITVAIGGTALLHISQKKVVDKIQHYAVKKATTDKYKLQPKEYYINKVTRMIDTIYIAINPKSFDFIMSFSIGIFGMALLLLLNRYPAQYAASIRYALFLLLSLNCIALWHGSLRTPTVKDIAVTPTAKFFMQQKIPYRIYNINSQAELAQKPMQYERFDPNYNMLFTIPHVGVYGALSPIHYFDLLGSLGTVNLALSVPPVLPSETIKHRNILNLLNARYIISNDSTDLASFSRVTPFREPYIFENKEALPQAFLVSQAIFTHNTQAILDFMHTSTYNPAKTVFVEADSLQNQILQSGKDSVTEVTILNQKDQYWKIHTHGAGWLVITDQFYPGWQAFVDGKQTKLYRGDYVFKTIPIQPGTHTVELVYVCTAFKHGLWITIGAMLLTLMIYVSGYYTEKNIRLKTHS